MAQESQQRDRAGACHCGAVRFIARTALADVVTCNCKFCTKRGALLQKMPAEDFQLTGDEKTLRKYGNRSFSKHFFCSQCGVHVFTRSSRNGENAVIVNIACLDGVDPSTFTPRLFDGAALL